MKPKEYVAKYQNESLVDDQDQFTEKGKELLNDLLVDFSIFMETYGQQQTDFLSHNQFINCINALKNKARAIVRRLSDNANIIEFLIIWDVVWAALEKVEQNNYNKTTLV